MGRLIAKSIFLFFVLVNLNGVAQICPTATSVSLITNGDFESGNTGFFSSYGYSASGTIPIGNYTITLNPSTANPSYFAPMTDHNTSGTGRFLIVDVDGALNKVVYQTTATGVMPNTTYFFAAWFVNIECITCPSASGNMVTCPTCPNGVYISNSPRLQFSVNGSPIGSIVYVDSLTNNWGQRSFIWNSGTVSGSAVISIANLRTGSGSNDLGIDEVSFGTSCSLVANLNSIGRTSAIPSVVSLCAGGGTYMLDPQLSTTNGTIWKNSGGTTLNTGARTYTVSSTGTYYLCYDTIPGCYRTDTVSVINTLNVNIGNDQNLCNPISTTLLTGVSVPPCTVTWFFNGNSVAGVNTANYFVNTIGSYYAVVRSPGCATATSNSVNITSSAPTPINATYCGASGPSTVNLSISPTNSGRYKWWNSPTATTLGSLLQRGGSTYGLPVSGTATFVVYAEDTSVVSLTRGPLSSSSCNNTNGWSENGPTGYTFNVATTFILDSITIRVTPPGGVCCCNPTFQPRITISNASTGFSVLKTPSLNCNGTNFYKVPLGISLPVANGYKMTFSGSSMNMEECSAGSGFYPINNSPYLSVTGRGDNLNSNYYGAYNWVIRTGTICARVPVVASNLCALGIENVIISAYRKESKDIIHWQMVGIDVQSFSIERSLDGVIFEEVIGNLDPEREGNNISISNIGIANAYYRIKTTDNFNKVSYSKIAFVAQANVSFDAVLFPNPSSAIGAKLISNVGIQKVEIFDQSGKLVDSFESHGENEIQINGKFAQGLYYVKVSGLETTKTIKWQVLH